MSRGRKITVFVAVILAIGGVVGYFSNEILRLQLGNQSSANLTFVICSYVREHKAMPAGFDDLIAAGLLRKLENGELQTVESPHVLYALDELSIHWDVDLSQLTLVDGRVVDRQTHEPVYIIEQRSSPIFDNRPGNAITSKLIYDAFLKAADSHGDQSAPN